MLTAMIVVLLQALPATGAAAATADPGGKDVITVVGVRMADLKADVDGCIKGGCSPRQDVIASVRYAEAQFREGNYAAARLTLAAAVARVREHGREEPIAISQLYVAQATVAEHYGDRTEGDRAIDRSAAVLRDALGTDDIDTLTAELRVADVQARKGYVQDAERQYRAIAERATKGGHSATAGVADLRRVHLLHLENRHREAAELLTRLAASPIVPIAVSAKVSQARFARERGDSRASDALIAELARSASTGKGGPSLVYQPPIVEPADANPSDPFTTTIDTQTRSSDYAGISWVDIGFWIKADGNVDGAEVLRGTPGKGWTQQLLRAIAGRRYTAFASPGSDAGDYRVERWTRTADFSTPVGSLIRRRTGTARYERLDISRDPPGGEQRPTP